MLYAFFCAARSQGGTFREYIKKSRESNHSGLHFDQPRGQAEKRQGNDQVVKSFKGVSVLINYIESLNRMHPSSKIRFSADSL